MRELNEIEFFCLLNLLIQRVIFMYMCLSCVIFVGLRVCNNHKNEQEMNWSRVNSTRTIFFSSLADKNWLLFVLAMKSLKSVSLAFYIHSFFSWKIAFFFHRHSHSPTNFHVFIRLFCFSLQTNILRSMLFLYILLKCHAFNYYVTIRPILCIISDSDFSFKYL